jgi:hypothetical protein
VNYNPSYLSVNPSINKKLNTHPLEYQKEREVKLKLNREQKRKIIKIFGIATTTLILSLIIGTSTFAATPTTVPMNSSALTMNSIRQMGTYLIGITTTGGMILAIILRQVASGYNFLRRPEEASKWTSDIMKGFAQILMSPISIIAMALLAKLLFSGLPFFVSPF